MPEGSELSGLPTPRGSPLTLRELPKHRAAVLAFSGRPIRSALETSIYPAQRGGSSERIAKLCDLWVALVGL